MELGYGVALIDIESGFQKEKCKPIRIVVHKIEMSE